jgi:hypothetical protein
MIKCDFNYFTQRVGVLNEMARPSKLLAGESGAKMSEYIKKIGSIMKAGGTIEDYYDIETGERGPKYVPGYAGSVQNRVYRYIVFTIGEFEGIDVKFDTTARQTAKGFTKGMTKDGEIMPAAIADTIPLIALNLLGITDKTATATGFTANELLSKGFAKWASENPEKVSSPEFTNELLDPQNILGYLKDNRSSKTGSGRLKDEKLKAAHGAESVEEIHDTSQRIQPLIKRINALMKAELMKKNPSISSDNVVDQDTFNITYILYNLESYITLKKTIDGILGVDFEKVGKFDITEAETIRTLNDQLENPLPEMALLSLASFETNEDGNTFLHTMYEDFEDFIEDGISREDFESTMRDYIEYSGLPDYNTPFLKYLATELLPKNISSEDFPGYPQHILDQVLGDSPENWEAFSKYYEYKENEKHRKSEERSARSDMGGYEDYKGFLPDVRRGYQEFLNRWKQIYETRQKNYVKGLYVDDDDNQLYPDEGKQKYVGDVDKSELEQGIKFATSGNVMDEIQKRKKQKRYAESNESYVMNYMSEQVSKDRFKPKGEFKDRGFRKLNYLEWLDKNS